jgi:hypothetical protein
MVLGARASNKPESTFVRNGRVIGKAGTKFLDKTSAAAQAILPYLGD